MRSSSSHADSSAASCALSGALASTMRLARAAVHDGASAGAIDTVARDRSRTLICDETCDLTTAGGKEENDTRQAPRTRTEFLCGANVCTYVGGSTRRGLRFR